MSVSISHIIQQPEITYQSKKAATPALPVQQPFSFADPAGHDSQAS